MIDHSFNIEENQDPYEIIYAESRNEEIQLQLLENAHLNAQMARWSLDVEYNQLLWSDGVYEILEIDSRTSGASYDAFMQVIHPNDRSIRKETQMALNGAKKPIEITYRLQMKDGRIKWINEICSTDYDQYGNPTRFFGIIQDITKYKRSEKKLLEKEDSYRALINFLPSGIAINQNNKITFVNPAGVHLLGAHDVNEIIGKPLTQFVHTDSIKDFKVKMNDVPPGKASTTFEEKLIRLNGSVFDAEITLIHSIINETSAIQLIVNDISDRKRTELALKKSEERYRLLTGFSSDYQWTINPEGIITYISPFQENYLGHPAKEIIKNELSKWLTPASLISCLIELEEMESTVHSASKMEPKKLIVESINHDGEPIWIETTTTAMYNSANSFIGFSGIGHEITKEKKAEQIVEENKRMRENELHLKQVIETKDKFISIIAHDLRGPFNSIIGFLELLETRYEEFTDLERKENISLIHENASTALNLLENLLQWAKSQTSTIAFQPVRLKLSFILNSVHDTFKLALSQKSLTLKISIPDEIEILADANMLMSIFRNLISNAIKFSSQGGMIAIDAQEIQHQIEITVSDQGTGMSKETIGKLFKVGEDVSMPGTYNEKGSGLGLILCKDFVERHKGSISVESELGKGSKFIIRIPQM